MTEENRSSDLQAEAARARVLAWADDLLARGEMSEEEHRAFANVKIWTSAGDDEKAYRRAIANDPEERKPARGFYLEDIRSIVKMDEMSPERYVALHAHQWLMYGPLALRYPDPEVDAHVRRVEALMHNGDLDELRREWLTPEEYERVQAQIEEMKDPNYEY